MLTIGLYEVSKEFRSYNYGDRWLRQDLIRLLHGKRKKDEHWTVLSNICLEVSAGETVAIMGTNGSGKSTLLKIMAGIIVPTAGRVFHDGNIGTLLDIGTGFHDDLTGRENVFVNGAMMGLDETYVKAMIPEIEQYAELEGFLDTPIKYYSSGMRARLGFSVAMCADPDIFLIDEVLAVGDAGFRQKCYDRLDDLVTRGRTIVAVSHDTEMVERISTRGIWLKDGCIEMDGPVRKVCKAYERYFELAKKSSPEGI